MNYKVTIAIPTFKRPAAIVAAVNSVLPQVAELNSAVHTTISARILVIDNDPAGAARTTVARLGVEYVHEPKPGIAAVRNRAISESQESDVLIFLDDDEIATDGWLRELIKIHRESGADAVAGRVHTEIPQETDPWIEASTAFVRPVRNDRQVMSEAATNNLLLDLRSVKRLGVSFDEAFGLTGGSDSLFTRQIAMRGGVIRWSQDALVVEIEDPERLKRSWILMRAFRFGNTGTRVDIVLANTTFGRLWARISRLGRGLLRVLGGGARVLVGFVLGSLSLRARGARTLYRGIGMIAGSVGVTYNEYGRRRRRMESAAD